MSTLACKQYILSNFKKATDTSNFRQSQRTHRSKLKFSTNLKAAQSACQQRPPWPSHPLSPARRLWRNICFCETHSSCVSVFLGYPVLTHVRLVTHAFDTHTHIPASTQSTNLHSFYTCSHILSYRIFRITVPFSPCNLFRMILLPCRT